MKDLEQLAEEFIKSLKVRNMAKRTIKFGRWKLGKFLIFLNERSIEKPDQISKASTKDLMKVRGVGKKTADIIFRNLH